MTEPDETLFARDLVDAEARKLLIAAYHALRSYEHGNSSEELAAEIADEIGRFLGPLPGESDTASG